MVDETTRVDDPAQFPPQEDTVERLWTPQRMTYVLRNDEGKVTKPKSKECPFCAGPKKSDEDPYNVGHLMICPYRHVSFITDLDDAELFEFEKATTLAMTVMKEVSHPDGWNIGINQGEVAGAGIAAHLHQHVVPRWNGDANFMPIVAQTRTMPILLSDQRAAYAEAFERLAPQFDLPYHG